MRRRSLASDLTRKLEEKYNRSGEGTYSGEREAVEAAIETFRATGMEISQDMMTVLI